MSAPITDLLARYDAAVAAVTAAYVELAAVATLLAARTPPVCVHHRDRDGDVWGTFHARPDNRAGWTLAASTVKLSGDHTVRVPPDAATWATWRANDDLADRCDAAYRALFDVGSERTEAETALLAALPGPIEMARLLVGYGWTP